LGVFAIAFNGLARNQTQQKLLDLGNLCLLGAMSAELMFLFYYCGGPHMYLNWASYVGDKGTLQQFKNRINVVITLLSVVGVVCSYVYFGELNNWCRFFMSLLVFRLLIVNDTIAKILYALVLAVPMVYSLVGLLFVMVYVFGIMTVWFFKDSFYILAFTNDGIGFSCCQQLENAVFMHVQLLVGSDWHSLMYGAARIEGLPSTLYFIGYMVVVHVLLSDLLVGVIITFYELAYEVEELSDDIVKQAQMMADSELRKKIIIEQARTPQVVLNLVRYERSPTMLDSWMKKKLSLVGYWKKITSKSQSVRPLLDDIREEVSEEENGDTTLEKH